MICPIPPKKLAEYVLGDVDLPTSDEIRAHLANGCEMCCGELRELENVADLLAVSNRESFVDSEVWQRVQQRLSTSEPLKIVTVGPPRLGSDSRPAIVAFVLATACTFGLVVFASQAMYSTGVSLASNSGLETAGALEQSSLRRESTVPTRQVSIRRADRPDDLRGRFLVEPSSRQIHLFAQGWPRLDPDQRYVMWFVTTDQTVIEGDHLDHDAVRSSLCLVDLPETSSPLAFMVVTVERDENWSLHQKQPVMASGSKLQSARFVSDNFGDLLDLKI